MQTPCTQHAPKEPLQVSPGWKVFGRRHWDAMRPSSQGPLGNLQHAPSSGSDVVVVVDERGIVDAVKFLHSHDVWLTSTHSPVTFPKTSQHRCLAHSETAERQLKHFPSTVTQVSLETNEVGDKRSQSSDVRRAHMGS